MFTCPFLCHSSTWRCPRSVRERHSRACPGFFEIDDHLVDEARALLNRYEPQGG